MPIERLHSEEEMLAAGFVLVEDESEGGRISLVLVPPQNVIEQGMAEIRAKHLAEMREDKSPSTPSPPKVLTHQVRVTTQSPKYLE